MKLLLCPIWRGVTLPITHIFEHVYMSFFITEYIFFKLSWKQNTSLYHLLGFVYKVHRKRLLRWRLVLHQGRFCRGGQGRASWSRLGMLSCGVLSRVSLLPDCWLLWRELLCCVPQHTEELNGNQSSSADRVSCLTAWQWNVTGNQCKMRHGLRMSSNQAHGYHNRLALGSCHQTVSSPEDMRATVRLWDMLTLLRLLLTLLNWCS